MLKKSQIIVIALAIALIAPLDGRGPSRGAYPESALPKK